MKSSALGVQDSVRGHECLTSTVVFDTLHFLLHKPAKSAPKKIRFNTNFELRFFCNGFSVFIIIQKLSTLCVRVRVQYALEVIPLQSRAF